MSRRFPEVDDSTRTGADPPNDHPEYVGTRRRAPKQPLVILPSTETELTGPAYGESAVEASDADLTRTARRRAARPADRPRGPCPRQRREAAPWSARSRSGRRTRRAGTATTSTSHDAPLDPNFSGAGRCLTDDDGRYRFVTIKPGIYPWGNHPNAWRPAHIHFSLFGRAFTERLITQMYFPDDPLFPFDPIFNSVRDEAARSRLVSTFDIELTEPDWALGFRWDIVLGGREATPLEEPHHD